MKTKLALLIVACAACSVAQAAEPMSVGFDRIGKFAGADRTGSGLGAAQPETFVVDNAWDLVRYRVKVPGLPRIDPEKQMLIVLVSWESRKRTLDDIVVDRDMLIVRVKEEYVLRESGDQVPPKFVVARMRAWRGPVRFDVNGQSQFTLNKGEQLKTESRKLWAETSRLLGGGEPTEEQKIRFFKPQVAPGTTREQMLKRIEKETPFEVSQQRLVTFRQLAEQRAAPVVDELFALLEQERNLMREEFRTFRPAWEALVAIGGEEVVDGCRRLQGSDNKYARHAAILILRDFGLEATRDLAHAAVRDAYDPICRCGMDLLGRIGLTKEDVPALVDALANRDLDIVQSSAYLLGQLRSQGKAAVPALEELQLHRVDFIRAAAREALSKIQSEG